MSILIVGSVAFDSVKTPFGEAEDALGGSATYFSVSASYFNKVNLVAVVGNDFPKKHIDLLKSKNIDVQGLQVVSGKTFRWKGRYNSNLNEALTLDTKLNVFADFKPEIPVSYKNSKHVFLGNIDPNLQLEVLKQVKSPELVACDTMNFWISSKKNALKKTLKHVDILVINEAEVKQLSCEENLIKGAKRIVSWGPKYLVIKRGEYGALLYSKTGIFAAPAIPLERVKDPTGAGDSFGGGFMGYLSKSPGITDAVLRKAIIYGSVMASYNVEDFSLRRLAKLTNGKIQKRYKEFCNLTKF